MASAETSKTRDPVRAPWRLYIEKNSQPKCKSQGSAGTERIKQSSPSENLLRRAKEFQDKLRRANVKSLVQIAKREKKKKRFRADKSNLHIKSNGTSSAAGAGTTSDPSKGKSYKTRSDIKLKEPSIREYFLKSYIYDTKNGAINSKTEFLMRKDGRLGCHRGRLRADRIHWVEDRHEEGQRGEFSPGYSFP